MDTVPCAQYLSVVPLSTASSLVTANIVHNHALIAHCQRISQSNRPPHHAHPLTSQQGFTRRRPYSLALALTHDDQVSPSPKFVATSSDVVLFLCDVALPSFSSGLSYQRWFVGKERERTVGSHSSYYNYEERYRSATVTAQTSHERAAGVFKMVIWCVSIALGLYSICSSTVHLADTRPHSPATLDNGPLPHTSIIGSSHIIHGEAGHAPTCLHIF